MNGKVKRDSVDRMLEEVDNLPAYSEVTQTVGSSDVLERLRASVRRKIETEEWTATALAEAIYAVIRKEGAVIGKGRLIEFCREIQREVKNKPLRSGKGAAKKREHVEKPTKPKPGINAAFNERY